MTHKQIESILQILNKCINTKQAFKDIADYQIEMKSLKGSSFAFVDDDESVALIKLTLENITMPFSDAIERDKNNEGINFPLFKELENLTYEFSFVSGLSLDDWSVLATYMVMAHERSLKYVYDIGILDSKVRLLLGNPWLFILLLLELTPFTLYADIVETELLKIAINERVDKLIAT